ncbi:MAG: hypothetical protein QOH25_33 [Acidobacteriota bacterium]|nr:hypothetical protein [Acidobacteriota bacterium]
MAKKIITLVREKMERMQKPTDEGRKEANDNAILAIAAVLGGIKSEAWRTYMLQFVDKDAAGTEIDPRQLRRLLATDDTVDNFEQDVHRVYLVSNGPCGANSPDGRGFDLFVESIDEGLDDDPCDHSFRREDLPASNRARNF